MKISSSSKRKISGALWRAAQQAANTALKTQAIANPSRMKRGFMNRNSYVTKKLNTENQIDRRWQQLKRK
jgi:hypothetical protein